jgi:hypothetical protein
MALSSGGDQFADAVKQGFGVGQRLIDLRQAADLTWWRGLSGLDSAVRNVLNEFPQVQVVGPVGTFEGQFTGVPTQVNVDGCGSVGELDFKFRVDSLLWPLERAHSSAADLQHVMQ